MIGKMVRKMFGEGHGSRFLQIAKGMNIFVPHVTSCLLQGDINRGLQTVSRKDVPFCVQ